jgi:hypothetical protein
VIAIGPIGRRRILSNSDFVFQRFVHGLVGDTETASAEDAFDLVTVQAIAGRQRVDFLNPLVFHFSQ